MSGALLVDDLPWLKPIAGHHGAVPFYLTGEMFGGLPVEIAAAELSAIVDRPVADEHRHAVPEIYLVLAPEPGGAEIEVSVSGAVHRLAAPAALYVPAGAPHRFVTTRAVPGSFCLGVLLVGETGDRTARPAHALDVPPPEKPPSS